MKLNSIKTIKTITPNRNLFKKIGALSISILIIIGSFVVITNANKDAKNTIKVLRIKADGGMPAHALITEDHIEKYDIIAKEFSKGMILAEDMPNVVGKYTKYYMRKGSVIYRDELLSEKPQKNEWLYDLNEESEVLTIPYNYLDCGGDILTPGDRVRIRVSYETTGGADGGNPNMAYSYGNKVKRTEVLFDSIVVKDMLNANSHSIYEVYKEVLRLDEDKRQKVMKSNEFLKNIQPKALVLEGSRDQIDNYAKYKGIDGKSFLITILSRKYSNVVIDQLPTLENEVESWIEKKKD